MRYKVKRSIITGHVSVPPSKSHTLRALVFGLMGYGESVIRNYLVSPDTMSMIDAVKMFGAQVQVYDDVIQILGAGSALQCPDNVVDAGNSGLVLRFITALAALVDQYVIITGDESIRSRRMIKPLLEVLSSQNVLAESAAQNGFAPVIIKGPLKPGVMAMEGSDSQPVSAMIIATAFLPGPSEIYVMNPGEKPWVDVTLRWLSSLNVKIQHQDHRYYKIPGNASYEGFEINIPGDFSSATYSIVAAVITKQKIRVSELDMRDNQADKNFLDVLKRVGVSITVHPEEKVIEVNGEVDIKGMVIDVNHCIDTTPLLAVLACFANGPTEIIGARVARFKESDRISAISQELKKMGAKIEEKEDGMVIYPSRLRGAHLYSHKDHRIALSLIVAAFAADGESIIDGVEYIIKTYPTFFHDFVNLGGKIER